MNISDAAELVRISRKLLSADEGECWLWGASLDRHGYGQVKFRGTVWKAHRAVYTLFVGAIPDGLEIDHLCRVRRCCSPEHLEPVTGEENIRRYRESLTSGNRLPGLIADVVAVLDAAGRERIHTADLLTALGAIRSDIYGGWDAERFSAELAMAGVRRTVRQVKISGVNRAGYRLADFLAAPG